MNTRQSNPPQLLVSVRDAIEAVAALKGDCDVLDVKEPARGALGMADIGTIAAIIDTTRGRESAVPVSMALGEAAEWGLDRSIPRLPEGIAYLKMGTSQLPPGAGGASHFSSVQRRFENAFGAAFDSGSPQPCGFASSPRWIAVAYADFELARAPAPEEIAELAAVCGCTGLLIDTFSKQGKRLLDWLDDDRLAAIATQSRTLGLTFALAGRLQAGDLPRVLAARPDVIGIRSAACRAGDRTGSIDAAALCAFRSALDVEASRRRRVDFSPRAESIKSP